MKKLYEVIFTQKHDCTMYVEAESINEAEQKASTAISENEEIQEKVNDQIYHNIMDGQEAKSKMAGACESNDTLEKIDESDLIS